MSFAEAQEIVKVMSEDPPEYSAKRGPANYEINRSRCHRPHKLNTQNPFIDWMVRQFREQHWSLDACVGYVRKNQLFPKDQIVCTKTLYNELLAGNLPLKPSEVPELLFRTITLQNRFFALQMR